MYGENAFANPSYGRIVNRKHFDRISGLIEENKVVYGGRTKEETLQIEPTILFPVSEKDAVMQEEIFGPVLPILVVENMDEAQRFVQNRENRSPAISSLRAERRAENLSVIRPLAAAASMTP